MVTIRVDLLCHDIRDLHVVEFWCFHVSGLGSRKLVQHSGSCKSHLQPVVMYMCMCQQHRQLQIVLKDHWHFLVCSPCHLWSHHGEHHPEQEKGPGAGERSSGGKTQDCYRSGSYQQEVFKVKEMVSDSQAELNDCCSDVRLSWFWHRYIYLCVSRESPCWGWGFSSSEEWRH